MKKILTCLLLISILTACFVVGLFALSVVKDDKEFNEVTTEVTKYRRQNRRHTKGQLYEKG